MTEQWRGDVIIKPMYLEKYQSMIKKDSLPVLRKDRIKKEVRGVPK